MARERPDHTLQASALVNEAYLRLIDLKQMQWQNRAHFFAMSARVMRRILVDFARAKGAAEARPRYLSGGFIDCRTSMRACWLTVRVPSCGRSRSAISAMTAEKVTATTMMASDRIVPTSPA